MISYDKVKDNAPLLIALTGLTFSEFEKLLVAFEKAWEDYIIKNHIDEKERQRHYGGGRKPVLENSEDKLLFILIYFKLYPLQIFIGFLFGMGQSQANEWIHKLSAILKTTLDNLNVLPERDSDNLEEALEKAEEKEVAIDGTERRRQRPKDNEKQKEFYSGKKKAHTMKNNIVVTVEGRKIIYLSGTYEGKKHDKKICDDEALVFPEKTIVNQDTGFQGYEPEGVIIKQPKKKPRGGELSLEEKNQNSIFSSIRVVVEHVISGIKRCRIVKDVLRNTKENYDDLVIEISCGLHNFRTEHRLSTS
jgi:hypothetical protein